MFSSFFQEATTTWHMMAYNRWFFQQSLKSISCTYKRHGRKNMKPKWGKFYDNSVNLQDCVTE